MWSNNCMRGRAVVCAGLRRRVARRRALLCVPLLLFVFMALELVGLVDFARETDFAHFRWPAYVDVREQVAKELTGHPPDHQPLNPWSQFPLAGTISCRKASLLARKRSLLIIVKTAWDRVERRNAYRQTLSKVTQLRNWRIRTVFVLGRKDVRKSFETDEVYEEAKANGDMIVGNFVDHYFNNTYKFVHALRAARLYCTPAQKNVPWTVLIDDDFLISVPRLLDFLQLHQPNEQLYAGQRFDTSPFRLRFHKFAISVDDYPYTLFPPYVSGGFVVLSPQAINEFYLAVQYLKHLRFDDVYAGIVSYVLGYDPLHISDFSIQRARPLDFSHKMAEHNYAPDEIRLYFAMVNEEVGQKRAGPTR